MCPSEKLGVGFPEWVTACHLGFFMFFLFETRLPKHLFINMVCKFLSVDIVLLGDLEHFFFPIYGNNHPN